MHWTIINLPPSPLHKKYCQFHLLSFPVQQSHMSPGGRHYQPWQNDLCTKFKDFFMDLLYRWSPRNWDSPCTCPCSKSFSGQLGALSCRKSQLTKMQGIYYVVNILFLNQVKISKFFFYNNLILLFVIWVPELLWHQKKHQILELLI